MHILKKLIPFCCLLLLVGCNSLDLGKLNPFNSAKRVYDDKVPVQVLDEYTFKEFIALFPDAVKKRGIVQRDDGRFEPLGSLSDKDYTPASYAEELRQRFDYLSFDSVLGEESFRTAQLHNNNHWSSIKPDAQTLNTDAIVIRCSYLVFATLDWNNNGIRDWLVVTTQNHKANESLNLTFWLVIEDPEAQDFLSATLLGMEEQNGIGQAKFYTPKEAEKRLDLLRVELRDSLRKQKS
ncbi:hypothetical protein [Desulfovibrio litoralis]|uniref:Lipoprotein n=1 Tax=Desulfovibrio litoralis DSM 11393 TaxID=1121455 RepID=A0A1M7TDL8_9BACT|nr:hypothetical protein [Desulfovibrio litoralis]SHN68793.1 hypothetical protein SAMN02745728_01892 [Desulfovibrio litoralis DSM 11393]